MAQISTPDAPARLLCLMGSGELSPTMVGVHAELMVRVGVPPATAVMLDTSYGFQENADELTAKVRRYFRVKVGRPVEHAAYRAAGADGPLAAERTYQLLRQAHYVFAGPGSPSYTIRHWRGSPIPGLLEARLAAGGCVTLASAAAIAIGRLALPVYEIYKVGEPPHWIDGLDLLSPFGLDFAVVTHYDNTEGGTHDTRYCYMGARRFQELERQLPSELSILGVGEHTAAIFDFDAGTLDVRGRGSVVIRRRGLERSFAPGKAVALEQVRQFASADDATAGRRRQASRAENGSEAFFSAVLRDQKKFARALEAGAVDVALTALLGLDDRLVAAQDADHRPNLVEEARSIYRGMVLQLGEAAQRSLASRQPLAQIAEIALRLRDRARLDRRYGEADRLRDALRQLGLDVRDTPDGTQWSLVAKG